MLSPPWGSSIALSGAAYSAVELDVDNARVFMLEQRRLPVVETYVTLTTCAEVAAAISDMIVRGAPAIGVAAAYGMVLAVQEAHAGGLALGAAAERLAKARPTAVNLTWAVDRMLKRAASLAGEPPHEVVSAMAETARQIHRDDVAACRAMGAHGAAVLPDVRRVLTHCNAGALATGGHGTALGVIRSLKAQRSGLKVFATETRPYLQGARLTAWELARDEVDVTVIGDSMVGALMRAGEIDAVVVGADRIAHNGDVANKIGTYQIACLAAAHQIPMVVAAPWSTFDAETSCGADIPIEQRAASELTHVGSTQLVPSQVPVLNPGFDVTPAELVHRIATETGAFAPRTLANHAPVV